MMFLVTMEKKQLRLQGHNDQQETVAPRNTSRCPWNRLAKSHQKRSWRLLPLELSLELSHFSDRILASSLIKQSNNRMNE